MNQLLLFPEWWHNPDLWKERHTISNISRPTENQALENIYTQSLIVNGQYRTVLSDLEKEVYDTYIGFKSATNRYKTIDYMTQTAIRLKMPLFQVRDILESVNYIKRNFERAESQFLQILPDTLDRIA